MNTKRFEKMTSCESYLVEDETTVYKLDDIVELMNELNEENQQLKDVNTRCCNEYSYFHKQMMKLEKENEQIKHLIDEAIRNERTELGQSVLKQLKEKIE